MKLIIPLAAALAIVLPCHATAAVASAPNERIVIASSHATMSEGEVRKVDAAARKITIKHGELKNLDMPPMTMVFQVKDPAMLEEAKVGDKVRFRADKINGALTVIAIEVIK